MDIIYDCRFGCGCFITACLPDNHFLFCNFMPAYNIHLQKKKDTQAQVIDCYRSDGSGNIGFSNLK